MTQAMTLIVVGLYTMFNANKDWLTLLIGFIIFSIGVILGEALENKTKNRIEKLEKDKKEEIKYAWDYDGFY